MTTKHARAGKITKKKNKRKGKEADNRDKQNETLKKESKETDIPPRYSVCSAVLRRSAWASALAPPSLI